MGMENDLEEITAKLLPRLKGRVKFALIFGSAAQSRLGPESDIDLGVFLDPDPWDWEKRQKIRSVLQEALDRELDWIVLNDADPIITHQVLSGGTVILNEDPDFFSLFQAQKASEYIDFKRNRKVIEDNLLKKGWPQWRKKT